MNDGFRWTLKDTRNENAVYCFESEDLGLGFVTWKEVLAMKGKNLFDWPVVFFDLWTQFSIPSGENVFYWHGEEVDKSRTVS